MRIREIVTIGLDGAHHPIRIAGNGPVVRVTVPANTASRLADCLLATLFPRSPSVERLDLMAPDDTFEVAIVLDVGDKATVRVARGRRAESVRLQVLDRHGQFATRASGADAVEQALERSLKRPGYDCFVALNLQAPQPPGGGHHAWPAPAAGADDWLETAAERMERANLFGDSGDFSSVERPATPAALRAVTASSSLPTTSPAEIERMKAEYVRAQKAEALEDQIRALRFEMVQVERPPQENTLVIEQELEKARTELMMLSQGEVSDEELALLRDPDARAGDFARRREALETRLTEVKARRARGRRLWTNPFFLSGSALALICTAASILGGPEARAIALGNVVCLSGTLFGLLQFLRARDEGRNERQQQLGLEEGLADLDEEQRRFDRELGLVRRRHGVQTIDELGDTRARKQELEAREQELVAERDRRASASGRQSLSPEMRRHQERIDDLQRRRDALGDIPLGSFQIAQELARFGVRTDDLGGPTVGPAATPSTAQPTAPIGSSVAAAATDDPVLAAGLRDLLDDLGLRGGSGLDPDLTALWSRLASAALGRTVTPTLSGTGDIDLGTEPGAGEGPSQQRIGVETLRLAVLLHAPGRVDPSPWSMVFRFDPFEGLEEWLSQRLEKLYTRISPRLQIILVETEPAARLQP